MFGFFFLHVFAQLTHEAGSAGLVKVGDKVPTDVAGAGIVRVSFKHVGMCVVQLRGRLKFSEAFQQRFFRRLKKSSHLAKGYVGRQYECGLVWENEVQFLAMPVAFLVALVSP